MPRNILDDIKPLTSTSRKASAPASRKKPAKEKDEYEAPEEENIIIPPIDETPEVRYASPSHSRKGIWIVATVAVIVLIGSLSMVFAGATVDVVPKSEAVTLDGAFTAKSGAGENELGFEIISLDESASVEATPTGTKQVEVKASGTVIIYNENTASQPLKIETRLSDKNNKIYKTDKAVTVPGAKIVKGKKTPGSVEVGVHADGAGPDYNIGLSDFKVVGFKGSAKYTTVYARGKTKIEGGKIATEPVLEASAQEQLRTTLTSTLKQKLLDKANAQIPDGFMYYQDGIFYDIDDTLSSSAQGDKAQISQSGRITIMLFNEDRLAKYLAKRGKEYDGQAEITFNGLKELVFTLENKTVVAPKDAKEIRFTLKGEGTTVWNVDVEALRDQLVGKKKKEFVGVLAGVPSIKTAEMHIRPFWKNSFPVKREDIDVTIE